jgi:hypothetical protein
MVEGCPDIGFCMNFEPINLSEEKHQSEIQSFWQILVY